MSNDDSSVSDKQAACGIWVDSKQSVSWLAFDQGDGKRRFEKSDFKPFLWSMDSEELEVPEGARVEGLSGDGEFNRLIHFKDWADYSAYLKAFGKSGRLDYIRQLEHQELLSTRAHLFADMRFANLRRMQLDIETASSEEGSFPDALRPDDRILAIGIRCGGVDEMLVLQERTDASEKELLEALNECIQRIDPDVIEGHNIFKFDFNYLKLRAKRFKVGCNWGRFGQKAAFRNSRMKVAERWIDFPRCDLPGRTVVDTYLLAQIYDVSTRELMTYGLKDVARYLGVTPEDGGDRTYIAGDQIQYMFDDDRDTFLAYLSDDLRETEGVADRLLPTYFEQCKTFPITLQEACLKGTASKVDLVFQEEYYHRKSACPLPGENRSFAGGYSASFKSGVFDKVLHFDVASLYPSILLLINRNPQRDSEGVFIPMLTTLREYRLKYKKLARETTDTALAAEYEARQLNYKILINSFYGYLGFPGARFGDSELAEDVTAKGREILHVLIDFFEAEKCPPLEADTDGIYVAAGEFYDSEEELLQKAQAKLPEGIALEFDGKFPSMFCYKAKNYALNDGSKMIVRGSALRSRGIEPFLKKLSFKLIEFLLGLSDEDPAVLALDFQKRIEDGSVDILEIAKSEVLSQNPVAYKKKIDDGGKPRRASAEVALKMGDHVRMGDRVTYYIIPKERGVSTAWQRARPVDDYNAESAPYDPKYYIKKLDDWRVKYNAFYPKLTENAAQGELF